MSQELKTIINLAAVIMAVAFVASAILVVIAARQIKKIRVPPHAGLVATLQGTPLLLVLGLDLLDMALDVLAAPIAWVILDYFGLQGLRGVTVIESLIPGTQLVPTLTLCWVVARFSPNRLKDLLIAEEKKASHG